MQGCAPKKTEERAPMLLTSAIEGVQHTISTRKARFYSHPETTLPEFSLGMTVWLTVWRGIVYVLLITITKALLQFWSIVLKMFVRTFLYGSCLLSSINTLSHTITCRTIICRGEVTWGKTPENAESMCDFVSLPDKHQLSLIHLVILPDKV